MSKVDSACLDRLSDHLQVTLHHHAFIYDLGPDKPLLVEELDDMDELYDPHKHIETGFKLY